jgi:hypothetical protein
VSLKIKILIFFLLGGLSLHGQSFMYSYIDPCTRETKIIMYDMSAPIVVAYYGQTKAFTYTDMQNGVFETWLNGVYSQFASQPCQGLLTSTTTTSTTNLTTNIVNSVLNLGSITSLSSIGSVGTNIGSNTNSGTNANGDNNNNSSNSNNNSNSEKTEGESSGNKEEETPPTSEEVVEAKSDAQKTSSSNTAKSTSKAKAETQKPAILVTGDIVGLQKTEDKTNDARGTFSYTRVKGDGTASLGVSADYMINAKIGNVSGVKSWIGTNQKGNKHINVASVGVGLMPDALSSTALFVRVNSLKHFTALYGAAGTYGQLFGEELISTIVIGGCMYKGKVTKALDATIIMAGIYSPYSKYYTESILNFKPIVIPFINLNYKLTKTFGIGLTGGGTYVAGKDVLNFQILMGAKLKL